MSRRPNNRGAKGSGHSKKRSKRGRPEAQRNLTVKLRTAKGRKLSSARWLQRQLNDPYVAAAKQEGYRSRAAYKLLEIDDKYQFLKPGACVVDLGAAPGGWSQVAAERVAAAAGKGCVLAVDMTAFPPLPGVTQLICDFQDPQCLERIAEALAGKSVDVVISDMAPPGTGHKQTDHLRIMALCELAFEFAMTWLRPGGVFLAKVFQGGTEQELLARMKRHFTTVRHVKPKASRPESSELYVLALNRRSSDQGKG